MAMEAAEIEQLIREALPGSDVTITDLRGDGDHYACHVVSAASGKNRIQQHQIVYEARGRMAAACSPCRQPQGKRITNMDTQTKSQIENEIASQEVVLFMKGTPVFPQCGFSAAVVVCCRISAQVQGVNVLEDDAIREGIRPSLTGRQSPALYQGNLSAVVTLSVRCMKPVS